MVSYFKQQVDSLDWRNWVFPKFWLFSPIAEGSLVNPHRPSWRTNGKLLLGAVLFGTWTGRKRELVGSDGDFTFQNENFRYFEHNRRYDWHSRWFQFIFQWNSHRCLYTSVDIRRYGPNGDWWVLLTIIDNSRLKRMNKNGAWKQA